MMAYAGFLIIGKVIHVEKSKSLAHTLYCESRGFLKDQQIKLLSYQLLGSGINTSST